MTAATDERFPRRQYRNPPVVEAIVRLHLVEPIPWSLTTPGLLFARLAQDYPREPQFQNVMQAEVAGNPGNPPNLQVTSGPQRVVFGNDDGSRLLIVGASDISAHGLVPYEGWESLTERLFGAVEAMGELVADRRFTGLGVRYINRIVIPETEFQFQTYLTIGFVGPPGFPPNVNAFFDRMESAYDDGRSRISFTWGTTDSDPGNSAFVLDLDLNWNCSDDEALTVEEAREELEGLKSKETAAFESLLQDRLREMFGEVA